MTRRLLLFRSKSCGVATAGTCSSSPLNSPPNFSLYDYDDDGDEEEEEEEEEYTPATTPFITTSPQQQGGGGGYNSQLQQQQQRQRQSPNQINNNNNQFQIVDIVVAVLRKSLVTCTSIVEEEEEIRKEDEDDVVEIGWPTDVTHVSHVTFDRYNGFLGLPLELQPQLPSKVPSASASVFGVSANSMQCSYDERGNSVPTILLMMQQHLYSEGGLQAEGIFRINAENSQEEYVRSQLNTGVVPLGIDVHCLAGLIKAWFRELPTGVLDSLSPEQVMHCNSEDDCTQLVKLLPPTEAALLDWAIHLMADVVHHESHNKMNARNIAMVFAPNMTKMADPLTALIHAVQVMNLLRTLIVKTLGQREEPSSCTDSHHENNTTTTIIDSQSSKLLRVFSRQQTFDCRPNEVAKIKNLFRSATLNRLESDGMEEAWGFQSKHETPVDFHDSVSDKKPTVTENSRVNPKNGVNRGYGDEEGGEGRGEAGEGIFERLNLKKGVRKLYRHPVFQLRRPPKKSVSLAIV